MSYPKNSIYRAVTDDKLIEYYFDKDKKEIGYHPYNLPELFIVSKREWSEEALDSLNWTKLN